LGRKCPPLQEIQNRLTVSESFKQLNVVARGKADDGGEPFSATAGGPAPRRGDATLLRASWQQPAPDAPTLESRQRGPLIWSRRPNRGIIDAGEVRHHGDYPLRRTLTQVEKWEIIEREWARARAKIGVILRVHVEDETDESGNAQVHVVIAPLRDGLR
jgi:hypothetical protein